MIRLFAAFIIISTISLISCSNSKIGNQYEFVEPNTEISADIGYLKIYSFMYTEKGTYSDDPVFKIFKGYTIYSSTGNFVMDVESTYENPELVRLPAGEYVVIAELYKNIIHSFPVNIKRGKILEIDKSMIENPLTSR